MVYVNNGEELEFNEHCIISQMIPTIGKDFYWGNEVLKENRYWDAIVYLENVYRPMSTKVYALLLRKKL